MSLYNSEYKQCVMNLLECLEDADIFSMAYTASGGRIKAENRKEAGEVIMLHTGDFEKLFSYRKITVQLLVNYLHSQKVSVDRNATKTQLVSSTVNFWKETLSKSIKLSSAVRKVRSFSSPSATSVNFEPLPKLTSSSSVESLPSSDRVVGYSGGNTIVQSDVFAVKFCNWYYSMVNRLQPEFSHSPGEDLSAHIFCSNCSVDLYLISSLQCEERHAVGPAESFSALSQTLSNLQILFCPNIKDGTQALKSVHGMVRVLCCGTLHKGNSFMGIFEQEFNLVQSPLDHVWRIVNTKLNLKHLPQVQSMPSLPSVEVFEITE